MKLEYLKTLEKVKRFYPVEKLQRLIVVCQNTRCVKWQVSGLEPMLFFYIWRHMKKNEFCLVFNEDTKLLDGFIFLNENGTPIKARANEEDRASCFNDWFEVK